MKKSTSAFAVDCEARMRAPTQNVASRRPNSTQANPTRDGSGLPAMTRSYRRPRGRAADDSRDGDVSPSSRKGRRSSRAIDLPDPLGPRNSSRPWWKVNVSSQ